MPLAARCAELGYTSMWSNDHPAASGLETLADFAGAPAPSSSASACSPSTATRRPRSTRKIDELGLDRDRLLIGVGAGFSKKPLTRMREAHDELREAIPGVRLILAAMGPKMCALAGSHYDGAFFNWMTAGFAAGARGEGRGGRRGTRDATPPRSTATSGPRSGPTRRPAWPRRRASTATSTTATATTSSASASRRAPSASRPSDPSDAALAIDDYEDALDTIVVRGLASANLDAMVRVAGRRRPERLNRTPEHEETINAADHRQRSRLHHPADRGLRPGRRLLRRDTSASRSRSAGATCRPASSRPAA